MAAFELPDLDRMSPEEMIDSVGVWYHCLNLLGHRTPGAYDMETVVEHYHLPTDMTGLSVLDVGASNGYFSFLFESRGARVVATDLPEFQDHDYGKWIAQRELPRRSAAELAKINWNELHGGFTVAHKLLGSRVQRVVSTVYEIPERCPGPFDVAFCSNVLGHLKNPVGALEAIHAVIKPGGRAIFATPVEMSHPESSAAVFVGEPKTSTWWVPTRAGLVRMCEASGFQNARLVDTYTIERRRGEKIVENVGVVHCDRPE